MNSEFCPVFSRALRALGRPEKVGQDRTFIKGCKMVYNWLYRVFDGAIVFSVCQLVGMHLFMSWIKDFFFSIFPDLTCTILNFCYLGLANF